MDRGVWWATVHGVPKSQIRLSNKHNILTGNFFSCLSALVHTALGMTQLGLAPELVDVVEVSWGLCRACMVQEPLWHMSGWC